MRIAAIILSTIWLLLSPVTLILVLVFIAMRYTKEH